MKSGLLFVEPMRKAMEKEFGEIMKSYQRGSLLEQDQRINEWAEVQVAHLKWLMKEKIKDIFLIIGRENGASDEEIEESLSKKIMLFDEEVSEFETYIEPVITLTAINIVYVFNMDFPLSEIREKYTPWQWIDEVIENIETVRKQKML